MPSFKETYNAIKENVANGEKNFNVSCTMLNEGMQCSVIMGESKHEFLIDAPVGLDGTDKGPSPLLAILGAIGACIIAVTKFWALIMDIKIESLTVNSRGHINLAALFGIDDNLLPGYDKLEPIIRIKADAPKEKIEEMMEKVLTHCPVITNFNGASPIKPKVQIRE